MLHMLGSKAATSVEEGGVIRCENIMQRFTLKVFCLFCAAISDKCARTWGKNVIKRLVMQVERVNTSDNHAEI